MSSRIESIYVCLPLGSASGYVMLTSKMFDAFMILIGTSDTHMLYYCPIMNEQAPAIGILTLRRYHSQHSYSDRVFHPSDLVTGSHHSRDLFPGDVDAHKCTASISHDDCAIEVHYRPEDNV